MATDQIQGCAALIAKSKDYETAPQGYVDQAPFVNRCLLVSSSLDPIDLLLELQAIELNLHRKRELRWGPRTIDIDIIWAKGVSMFTDSLILPHPRYYERAFVIVPMLDLPMVDPVLKLQLQHFLPLVSHQEVREII